MKKLIPVLALVLIAFLGSCEKKQLNDPLENSQNIEATTKAPITALGGSEPSDPELFERRMEWFSFITVKVIDKIPTTRAFVNGLLSDNNTIQASQLFTTETPALNPFEVEFRSILYDQVTGTVTDPDPDRDKPGLPIIPIPDPLLGDPFDLAVQDYIDYIVTENCVELYFPKGAITNIGRGLINPLYFTSTAHPLNTDSTNQGIKRLDINEPYPVNGFTTFVTVSNGYVNRNNNIVVARPKTTLTCLYTEYGTLDFTLFLD